MTHLGALALVMATTKKTSSGSSVFLLVLIGGFAALYFFFLRPQQQKAKKAREESRNFELGDEIVTVGGIVGRVVDIDGDRVTVVSGEGPDDGEPPTRLVFVRQAIARKAEPVTAAGAETHDDEDEEEEEDDDEVIEGHADESDDGHDEEPPPPRGRGFRRGRPDGDA
jgi:preprotein translocase subunit YajC